MICLFEDHLAPNFSPIADTRHLADLLVGAMTLRQRAARALADDAITLHGRAYLRDYYRAAGEMVERPADDCTFINARLPLLPAVVASFPDGPEWIVEHQGEVMAARLLRGSVGLLDWASDALDFSGLGLERHRLGAGEPYEYIWDLIFDNGERIIEDFHAVGGKIDGVVHTGAHLVNAPLVRLGAGSELKPGAVIDAGAGPVIIGRGVEVMPNAVIEGPCYIGDNSRIKIGAKIYGHTSIGAWCKVGGEVENSIILGYANKQHDGFLGHSYLGRWVNLGADTNTSDLKNNYGTIRVTQNGREINTGRIFLGTLFGDHAKTGINTMLNTGSVIGVAANVFGGGFPAKSIPPFAWGGFDDGAVYRLDEAIDVARRVMARRGIELTPADETLLRYLFGRRGKL